MWNENKIYIDWLEQHNIGYIEINSEEIDTYKQKWFEQFVPPEQRVEARNCYCFDEDGFCGYLWHVFSYELLASDKEDQANTEFDKIKKCGAVLLANVDNIAFQIDDASKLSAKDVSELYDVILTDSAFSWTYVKTHEPELGPYFHHP